MQGRPGIRAVVIVAVVLGAASVSAQPYDSGSTGVDGPLDFSSSPPVTTVDYDPKTHVPPQDVDGDGTLHFTTINIPAGVTVRPTGPASLHWLAQGAVQIDGTIDLRGASGRNGNEAHSPSRPGPGGFPGGIGGIGGSAGQAGVGAGGGAGGGNGGGGSYGTKGGNAPVGGTAGPTYGNPFLLPLVGGSGGGGGGSSANVGGGGGGAGGGALLIASSVSIALSGKIDATGGQGGNGERGGGGGSGGAVRLLAPALTGDGEITVAGGAGGGSNFFSGAGGGQGRVRLESFQQEFTGSVNGDHRAVTLNQQTLIRPNIPIPDVRVVSLAGTPVPENPTGSFTMPDVVIDRATPVTLDIVAHNVPLGTVVHVTIVNETTFVQTVDSTPLAGTADDSIATATATISPGLSSVSARASWAP
jgi:hypothetical protein